MALESKAKVEQNDEYVDSDVVGKRKVGELTLEELVNLCFKHYVVKNTHLEFKDKDLRDCLAWTKKAIAFCDGSFHPYNRKIIEAERFFDIEILEPWARYQFELGGQKFEGNLAIRGTVDLITELDDTTIELIDWKTGAYRTVFPTKKVKDFYTLQDDIQLQIYFWALSQLYPQYETIIITIYYINAGGPFSLTFHKEDVPQILNKIKLQFTSIKNNMSPQKNVGWWCKICPHLKTGNCEKIFEQIRKTGIVKTTEQYVDLVSFGQYKNPGE